jgi:aromatic ring hydroxylase
MKAVQENYQRVSGAMTDVKGDRGLAPPDSTAFSSFVVSIVK